MWVDCRDAAGPVWARHLAFSMLRGETYVLQIDSHMRCGRCCYFVCCSSLASVWSWQYCSDGSLLSPSLAAGLGCTRRRRSVHILSPSQVLCISHVFCFVFALCYSCILFQHPRPPSPHLIDCIVVSDLLTAGTRCCCLNSLHVATRRQCCQHIHLDTHCQMRYACVLMWFVSFKLSCDHYDMTSSFSCVSTSVVCCSHTLAYR